MEDRPLRRRTIGGAAHEDRVFAPGTGRQIASRVSQTVLAEYQLLPLLAPHYPLAAAVRQKVAALVGPSIVQARDVFDLAVLFSRAGGPEALSSVRPLLGKVVDRAMDVSYAEFKSQVASCLKPEHLDEYGTREAWNALQSRVVDVLQDAQS